MFYFFIPEVQQNCTNPISNQENKVNVEKFYSEKGVTTESLTRWCMLLFISLNKYLPDLQNKYQSYRGSAEAALSLWGVATSPSWLHYLLHTLLPSKYPCFVYERRLQRLSGMLSIHKGTAAGLMCRRDLERKQQRQNFKDAQRAQRDERVRGR